MAAAPAAPERPRFAWCRRAGWRVAGASPSTWVLPDPVWRGGRHQIAACGGAGRRSAPRRGRAVGSIARSAPCGAAAPLPEGHGCGVSARPPCATGEAGGRARTAGTATTIPHRRSHTGGDPPLVAPSRLQNPTQGYRSPTSRLVPSYAPRSVGSSPRGGSPDHTWASSRRRNLMRGKPRCSRKVCPMELSLPPSPARLAGLRRAARACLRGVARLPATMRRRHPNQHYSPTRP